MQRVEATMARVMSDGRSRSNSLTGHRWGKNEWRSDESVKYSSDSVSAHERRRRRTYEFGEFHDAREKLTKPCDASKTGDITVRQHSCTDAGLWRRFSWWSPLQCFFRRSGWQPDVLNKWQCYHTPTVKLEKDQWIGVTSVLRWGLLSYW